MSRVSINKPNQEAPVTVRVENVSKEFGRTRALDNISFEIKKGEVLGFLGPNGAGKTTAMRILTGFFPPTTGKIWVCDKDLFHDPKEVKRHMGYLPEVINLYGEMRVSEFLDFVADVKGVTQDRQRHIDQKLEECGLWDVRKRQIRNLSKGYRQRVGLAQALIGDPAVLILDEPTTGLDPKQIIEIRNLIRELSRERTVILSTHILPEVSMVCDRVLIINQGRIVASGTTDELEAGIEKRQAIFVVIGDSSKKSKAMSLLEKLSGVERISVVDESGDQVSFSLFVTKGQDLRPAVSRLFVEHQIPLLEIRTGRLSLEEIFMKIVVSENPAQEPE